MERVVCEAALKEVRIWNTGQTWKLFDLGRDSIERFGAPYWFVHRGDMHRALLDAVARSRRMCASTPASAASASQQDGSGVTLTLAGGETVEGRRADRRRRRALDGAPAAVRGRAKPEFMGIICWRGLVAEADLPEEMRRPVGTNWVGPGGHVITYPLRRGETHELRRLRRARRLEGRELDREGHARGVRAATSRTGTRSCTG